MSSECDFGYSEKFALPSDLKQWNVAVSPILPSNRNRVLPSMDSKFLMAFKHKSGPVRYHGASVSARIMCFRSMWPWSLKCNSDLKTKQLDNDQNRRNPGQFQPNLIIKFAPGSGLRYIYQNSLSLASSLDWLKHKLSCLVPLQANKHFPEYSTSFIN